VLLVATGVEPPGAQRDTLRAAQLLAERWRGPVRLAHLTGRGPRMSELVAELRRRELAKPAVVPYLLAPGHFCSLLRDRARSLGLDPVADVVGDHPHVAEAVARRYRAASARRFALSLSA
jgi:sirohydrochlorin ferrochelatase